MSNLPPAPPVPPMPGPPSGSPTGGPLGPTWGPGGWPTEPAKPDEVARLGSQIAVFAVGALAILIAAAAADVPEWGVAGVLALAAGACVGLATGIVRPFDSVPGAAAAVVVMIAATVLIAMVSSGGASTYAVVPLIGLFVLGLDWRLVRRLRALPFAFGFLVVFGVTGEETWTYPAALAWLAIALGALTSLEADRRAAQPRTEPLTAGPAAPEVRTTDVATTILVALAVALAAALLLSTPSCQRDDQLSSDRGAIREGGGESGAGDPGSGSGSGAGEGQGQGQGQGESGSASGSGSGSGRLYVPDPNGDYLIPNDGSANADPSATGIPSPESIPQDGPASGRIPLDDGSELRYERLPDGSTEVTVERPDGTTDTYTYRPRGDGMVEIQEFGEDGEPGRTLTYDPQGQMANETGDVGGSEGAGDRSDGTGDDPAPPDEPDDADDEGPGLDWRIMALVAALLAAVAGLFWWWSRRPPAVAPPADAPPWALRLAKDIERDGAARGRPRARNESLTRYGGELVRGPLPDPRVAEVVDIVDTALFARAGAGPDAQARAESMWAQIVEASPVPGRAERRRAASAGRP